MLSSAFVHSFFIVNSLFVLVNRKLLPFQLISSLPLFLCSAIAAHPRHAVKAYLLGGLSWFAIPFTLATTMGLAGRALMLNLEPADVGAGLVLPKAAFQLMGKGGAGCALLIVFMAVTSVGPFFPFIILPADRRC